MCSPGSRTEKVPEIGKTVAVTQQNLWVISRTTGCVFKAWQCRTNAAFMGEPTGVAWAEFAADTAFCLLKRSQAQLASGHRPKGGPARDSQSRAESMSRWPRRVAPSGSILGHPIFLP